MSNKKLVHYTMDEILREKADINLILGERSNGKSYQIKHRVGVLKYLETGRRFILLRRWKDELTTEKVERYFSDVDIEKYTEGKYNCIIMYRKILYLARYDIETGKTIKGDKIGYVIALSQEQNYAGASFLDVDDILFEEAISRNMYLSHECDKLMNLYSTVDRKRGTTKIWMVGNTISQVCPYFNDWGLADIILNMKEGTIETKEIQATEDDTIKIAIEYCKPTGVSSHVIGQYKDMMNKGAWQTDAQPHLPKSKNCYEVIFSFGFQYQNFKFMCENLYDNETGEQCFFIYPYKGEFKKDCLVFSDEVRTSPYWHRNIYDLEINNDRLKKRLYNFREGNTFYATDQCGTNFKQVIDFSIRK